MRNLMIFAAVLVALGSFMAQLADKMTPVPAAANAAPRKASSEKASSETVTQAKLRSLSIPRDPRGHFQAGGRINGQRLDFMVDTGASVVALNERSAARFGLRPSPSEYKATVNTANGTIKAAPARISSCGASFLSLAWCQARMFPSSPPESASRKKEFN